MIKGILIALACVLLAVVNIAAFKYLEIFAFFVTAASIPFAQRLLEMISALP